VILVEPSSFLPQTPRFRTSFLPSSAFCVEVFCLGCAESVPIYFRLVITGLTGMKYFNNSVFGNCHAT